MQKNTFKRRLRAALDLLDWKTDELSEYSGVSVSTLAKFLSPSGQDKLSPTNEEKIMLAISRNGVVMMEDGVRYAHRLVHRYEGQDDFRRFYDEIYETARDQGGNICLFNGVPAYLIKWLGKAWYDQHRKRMQEIKDNFSFRVIIKEDDRRFIGSDFAEYRWFPKNLFHDRTIYIFGDKVAFLNFEKDNVRVVVITQAETADSLRVLFDVAWSQVALPLPDDSAK